MSLAECRRTLSSWLLCVGKGISNSRRCSVLEPCRVFSVQTKSADPKEGSVKTYVVHIAETGEQKCSRPFTAATVRIATGGASTAGPASVRKRDQYVGAGWIGSGRGPAHCGRDRAIERTPALRAKCEVETCGLDFKQAGIRRHVDHSHKLLWAIRCIHQNRLSRCGDAGLAC
jgi:hypothetical protein